MGQKGSGGEKQDKDKDKYRDKDKDKCKAKCKDKCKDKDKDQPPQLHKLAPAGPQFVKKAQDTTKKFNLKEKRHRQRQRQGKDEDKDKVGSRPQLMLSVVGARERGLRQGT